MASVEDGEHLCQQNFLEVMRMMQDAGGAVVFFFFKYTFTKTNSRTTEEITMYRINYNF